MKLWNKIIGVFLGLSMAVGIGVAIGTTKEPVRVNAAEATANFTLSSASSTTVDGVTTTFAKASGSNAPAWYTAGLRLYAKNTVTISSSNSITGISFNWEKQGSKAFASATADSGSYSHPSTTGTGTWSGSASSVVFTLGDSGQLQLNTFSVTYQSAGPITTYTITYDANGGTGTMEDTVGADPSVAACTFTKDGYSFSEWNTSADGSGTTYAVGDTPKQDLDLYAIWAEKTQYILEPKSGSNNSYAGNCDIEIDGITWNLTGNSQQQPWRLGGKEITDTNRELYSKTAISEEIYKIDVIHGAASNVTVNSMTLIVASDADFESIISTLTPTFATNTTIEISRPSGVSWKNAYYKFIYNITISATSNKFLEFTRATFYYEQSSEGVTTWCESFLSTVTCDATGVTPPSKTAWSTMKTSFTALSDADKLTLKTLSNNATARYDYIVAKYGDSEYEDFIGRNPAPLTRNGLLFNTINNTNTIALITIITLVAVTSIGAIIFLKKKKVN